MAAKRAVISDPVLAVGLTRVQRALADWRQRRRPREPIPDHLWRMIVPLAQAHGISPVARALGLNYTALQQHSVACGVPPPAGSPAGGFVEVAAPLWPGGAPWSVELEDRNGAKVTVRLAGSEAGAVLALAQGLWRQRQ